MLYFCKLIKIFGSYFEFFPLIKGCDAFVFYGGMQSKFLDKIEHVYLHNQSSLIVNPFQIKVEYQNH